MGEPVRPADVAWWRMTEPHAPIVTAYWMQLDRPLSRQEAVQTLWPRLTANPRLATRIEGRRWVPVDLDLTREVTEHELGDGQVSTHLARACSTHVPAHGPLWNLQLLHHDGTSSLAWVVHHALGDGISTSWLMQSLSDEPTTSGHPYWLPQTPPRPLRMAALPRALWSLGRTPRRPATPWVGTQSDTKLLSISGPLDAAGWAERSGVRVDDALAAWVAGGLRRDLVDRGLPCVAVTAAMPANTRPPGTYDSLGNVFGPQFVPLPLHLEHAEARLAAICTARRAGDPGTSAQLGALAFTMMGLGPRWAQKLFERHSGSRTTLVMGHIPTQPEPLVFCGREVVSVGAWAPVSSGVSLTASLVTYRGRARLCLSSDAAQVPDLDALRDHILAEMSASSGP